MPPSDKVKRVVWLKSGGRCAICRDVLWVEGGEAGLSHFIGDVAHIVAEESGGPRGLSPLITEERNSETNLVLLCKPHHKIVDDDPATHTVAVLAQAKSTHEQWVACSLSSYSVWDTKLFHLYYINVPRLSLLAALQGMTLNLSRYGEIQALHELRWELNGLMAGFQKLLQNVQLRAIPLDSAIQQHDLKGMIVSFDHEFRTKNIQIPQDGHGFETFFIGDLKKDPHIYRRMGGYRLVANIDRRWITTTTAFCQFRPSRGQNHFAGLGFINSFDVKTKIISMTPYVIGMPSNPFMEAFYGAM